MARFFGLMRHLIFTLSFASLAGTLGALIHVSWLGVIGIGIGLSFALLLLLVSDRWLVDLLSAIPANSEPLNKEFKAAAHRISIRNGQPVRTSSSGPKIYVFPETYPMLMVVRSLAGRGIVIMSQGLLTSVRNARLSELAECALERLETPGLSRITAAGAVTEVILQWAPSGWSEWFAARALGVPISQKLEPLSWIQAVETFLLIPFVWFFGYLSSDLPWILAGAELQARFRALRPLIGSRLSPGLSHELPSLSIRGLALQMPLPEA